MGGQGGDHHRLSRLGRPNTSRITASLSVLPWRSQARHDFKKLAKQRDFGLYVQLTAMGTPDYPDLKILYPLSE